MLNHLHQSYKHVGNTTAWLERLADLVGDKYQAAWRTLDQEADWLRYYIAVDVFENVMFPNIAVVTPIIAESLKGLEKIKVR